jgi:hypothetical protein
LRYIRKLSLLVCILFTFCCCNKNLITRERSPPINYITPPSQPIILNIDNEFTNNQQYQIITAISSWENSSRGKVSFIYYFGQLKPGLFKNYYRQSYPDSSIFIWKINSDRQLDSKLIKYTENFAGVYDGEGNVGIFMKKFVSFENKNFYKVVLHELGHVLSMKHIAGVDNVMNPNVRDMTDCITELDSEQLCLIYGCKLKPECVFFTHK